MIARRWYSCNTSHHADFKPYTVNRTKTFYYCYRGFRFIPVRGTVFSVVRFGCSRPSIERNDENNVRSIFLVVVSTDRRSRLTSFLQRPRYTIGQSVFTTLIPSAAGACGSAWSARFNHGIIVRVAYTGWPIPHSDRDLVVRATRVGAVNPALPITYLA